MPRAMTTRSSGPAYWDWAHAYHLARRGAQGGRLRAAIGSPASAAAYLMLWPVGQPAGGLRDLARRSVACWLEVLSSAGLWHRRTGSLHLAYREDEARIIAEFLLASRGRDETLRWMDPTEVRAVAPRVRPDGLLGAMWSPEEVCVDPREVIAGLPAWLGRQHGVEFRFEDPVIDAREGSIAAASGRLEVGRAWICSGDEMRVLFPEILGRSGMIRCKLQMMRSQPFGAGRVDRPDARRRAHAAALCRISGLSRPRRPERTPGTRNPRGSTDTASM